MWLLPEEVPHVRESEFDELLADLKEATEKYGRSRAKKC